ncbi:MAG: hypothetical protein HQK96_10735, partial [Nitrospirae bacterium]|nr:hypothetical protein [Nitrospirota bacterium]
MIIKFSPKKLLGLDERGFILVVTMVLAMVALALSGAMLFMATIGTKVAGGYQRYTSTVSAARGASDVAMSLLKNSASSSTPDYGTVSTTYPSCLATKLNTATCGATATATQCPGAGTTYYQWGATCDTYANATSTNAAVDPDITTTYNDARTNSPAYTVYTKIINTQATTAASQGSTPTSAACKCNACTYCYIYTVLVLSKNINNNENSIVTFTYMV